MALFFPLACFAGARSSYDADTAVFLTKVYVGSGARIGALPARKIAKTIADIKASGLWSTALFAPLKLSENAGTGSVVYTIGGWTTNNIALANAPTWGATGIDFGSSNTTKYGTISISGFYSISTTVTLFARILPSAASSNNSGYGRIVSYGRESPDLHIAMFGGNTAVFANENFTFWKVPGNDTSSLRLGTSQSAMTWNAGEDFVQVVGTGSGGTTLYKNTAFITFDLTNGMTSSTDVSPATLGYTANNELIFGGGWMSSSYYGSFNGRMVALLLINSSSALSSTVVANLVNSMNSL